MQGICLKCNRGRDDKVPRPWSGTAGCPVVPSPWSQCPRWGSTAGPGSTAGAVAQLPGMEAAFSRQHEAKLWRQVSTGLPRRLGLSPLHEWQSHPARLDCDPSSTCCSWLQYHQTGDTKLLARVHCLHGDDCFPWR